MAVYKIFPRKDTFIDSKYPNENYGRDEILEISNVGSYERRTLIQFDNEDLEEINTLSGGNFTSSLKLYLSTANNIPEDHNIDIFPSRQEWIMGTGRTLDLPNPKNGACWNFSTNSTSSIWLDPDIIDPTLKMSQSIKYQDSLDINTDVTPIVNSWISNIIPNHGFLLKHPTTSPKNIDLKYFSIDTHTIYPPHLEFYWSDTIYSSSLPIIDSDIFISNIINVKNNYSRDESIVFYINNRDQYPVRSFQTSSVYLNNKILPEETYWALKDHKTNEIIIDYHDVGTKIGADNMGNYFKIHFNGLQPHRYYQILLKTKINESETVISDSKNIFKLH